MNPVLYIHTNIFRVGGKTYKDPFYPPSLFSQHKSFKCAIGLLVCLRVPGLQYEEEGALIELMICAIGQAAEAKPPVGRDQGKKVGRHTHTHQTYQPVRILRKSYAKRGLGTQVRYSP